MADKEKTRLRLRSGTGHVVGARGTLIATLTKVPDGDPIEGEEIHFYTGDGNQELGTAMTNDRGEAEFESGNTYGSPLTWGSALGSGVAADYQGSKQYLSHPKVKAALTPSM
ncbi:hypothetical protein ACIBJC_14295 [Streptomyces sp. NPDC050509]|uniref:hypothetical protein n=1 Tax=Streptomyces sp. NPDC050509 TaxID=3365620 RepID=UPI0037BC45D8